MAYVPNSGSVVAFQSDPTKLQVTASVAGAVSVSNLPTNQNVSGSVVAFPTGNQSVSGTVGASIIGLTPIQVPGSIAVAIVSGSIAASFTPPANQSVSGTVGASVVGHAPVVIVGGSIAASFTPPANQSVSGAVDAKQSGAWNLGSVATVVEVTNLAQMNGSPISMGAGATGAGVQRVVLATSGNGQIPMVLDNSTNASVIVVGSFAPAANQSVSGTVNVGNFPTNQNVSGSVVAFVSGTVPVNTAGSVVAFQGTSPWVGITAGSVAVAIVSGSVAVSVTPPANQSVSGTVGASVIGHAPVVIVGGSVAVSVSPPANQSVSGEVNVVQTTDPWNVNIVAGSVAVSVTPPANQSVSGAVSISNFPTNQNVSGSVVAVGNVGAGVVDSGNPVKIGGKFNASTVTLLDLQRGDLQLDANGNTKIAGTVTVTGLQGHSVSGTVAVSNFPTTQNVSGSVVAFGFPTTQNVSGSVAVSGAVTVTALQGHSVSGTVAVSNFPGITSVVNTIPSSMLVGASIIGLTPVNVTNTTINVSGSVVASGFPTTQNVSGSVVAFVSGTVPVNTAGSVVAFQGTNPWVIQSIVGTYAEDAAHTSSDKGLFVMGIRNDTLASIASADLDYTPHVVDAVGRAIIKPFAGEDATIISYTGSVVSGSVTLIQASAIGKRSYLTDWTIFNTGSVAQLVTFQGGDTSLVAFTGAPAGGGSNMKWNIPPKTTLSQDLAFKATGTTSILYVTVKGYQAQ